MSFDKNAKNIKISKTDDNDPDYWLHELQKKLDRVAVQSRQMDKSIFEQINTIMNGKSKYTSVEAAVEDMKERSGLKAYLNKINKQSEENIVQTKTAEVNKPKIIQECPMIENTLKNIIESTEGFLPVPAILEKLRSLHSSDVSTGSSFDDEDLVRFVHEMNKSEREKHQVDEEYSNLGSIDHSDVEIDPGNNDKFIGLMPATNNS